MHAHIDWESSDCDGTMSGSHVMLMTAGETASQFGDLEFRGRVVSDVVNTGTRYGTLTVEETEDGTPRLSWTETTDEGGRAVEATFYNDGECHESHTTTRRDHSAERAGY